MNYNNLVWEAGKKHSVDPALIKAVIAAESNFNPRAYRYEPHINDASYGLMQTLLNTARWMGYSGPPEGLFVPETSIEFGTRYLKHQLVRYNGQTAYAVAAYNSGTAKKKDNGEFINQPYVDRVLNFYDRYRVQGELRAGDGMTLRGQAPQMGPTPASPTRIQTYQGPNGEVAASFETLLSEENRPIMLALGTAVLLSVLAPRE